MQWRIGEYGKYESFIRDTERRYGLPVSLLGITLYQASKYDADHIAGIGRNPLGVIGIANITRADARLLWGEADKRLDPLASIAGAAVLLRAQYNRFGNWRLALLAYHSDETTVRNHLRDGRRLPIAGNAPMYTQQAQAYCSL